MLQPPALASTRPLPHPPQAWPAHPLAVMIVSGMSAVGVTWAWEASRIAAEGIPYPRAVAMFLAGLLLIFVPLAAAAVARGSTRAERIIAVMCAAIALYIVKIGLSPGGFSLYDEYIHLRGTQDIIATGRIFTPNPLLPAAAYYPGLAAVTAAITKVTGLGVFPAGIIVTGLARLLICACLFGIAETVTRSHRAAGTAAMMYAANPMFLWGAAFSYEDLGLPLAFFAVWWAPRSRGAGRAASIITVTAVTAVTVTHHMSGFALAAAFTAWYLTAILTRAQRAVPRTLRRSSPARSARRLAGSLTALTWAMVLTWFLLVAGHTAPGYLIGQNILPGLRQLTGLIGGTTPARHLYAGGPGATPPRWWQLAGFTATAAVMLLLLPALLRTRTLIRRTAAARGALTVAMVTAACYPLTLLPRLTIVSGPLSSRTSEYEFAAIGIVTGILAIPLTAGEIRSRAARMAAAAFSGRKGTLIITVALAAVFAGGITIGKSYSLLLPSPPGQAGYPVSPQPDAMRAAAWARAHLGPGQLFAATITDGFALALAGETPVSGDRTWPLFYAPDLAGAVPAIRASGVRYVLADRQMTFWPPAAGQGRYVSVYEPGASIGEHPLPRADLAKFTGPCAPVLAAFGPLAVIDVTRITDGACTRSQLVPGTAGRNPS